MSTTATIVTATVRERTSSRTPAPAISVSHELQTIRAATAHDYPEAIKDSLRLRAPGRAVW
jgi:hypothetical protein